MALISPPAPQPSPKGYHPAQSWRQAATGAAIGLLIGTLTLAPVQAIAACPQDLAVYSARDGIAMLEFRPPAPDAAVESSAFRVLFAQNETVVDGIVMWTQSEPRPWGMVMHDCPEGDVTGEELAACTVWQGVVYAIAQDGTVGLLPRSGEAAPRLLLPDFGPSVRHSSLFGPGGISLVPWDVFELSGCQE